MYNSLLERACKVDGAHPPFQGVTGQNRRCYVYFIFRKIKQKVKNNQDLLSIAQIGKICL